MSEELYTEKHIDKPNGVTAAICPNLKTPVCLIEGTYFAKTSAKIWYAVDGRHVTHKTREALKRA